jgi:carboxymethylenebutenolidase
MQTRTVEVPTPDGPMAVYEAVPDGGAGRAVVVIQEAFGVNSHIEDVTRRFAAVGYHAVAPHLFHRTGDGVVPYGEFAKVLQHVAALSDEAFLADVDAALAHLAEVGIPAARTGIVGFCMGGRVTFLVAARRLLGAAVGFYGGGIVTQRFPQFPPLVGEATTLKTPWLGLFGGRDESIPVADVERLEAELKNAPVPTEVVLYPDAGHGFFCDQRDAYHAEAAADAWARTLAWLARHLGG